MDRYGYVLKKKEEKKEAGKYRKAELQAMTTYQLKEICRTERIIQGVVNPMDREELIRIILKFRGGGEHYLIRTADAGGLEALELALGKCILKKRHGKETECRSKIVAYEGLAIGFYDGLTIPYDAGLAGTNALVMGGDGMLCAILNVEAKGRGTDCLYLTKAAGLPCRESGVKDYSLCLVDRKCSEILYGIYYGKGGRLPERMEIYRIPLVDFEVREPAALPMPLAVDFGTANTVAGTYLDRRYFEQAGIEDGEYGLKENEVNYALFYDQTSDCEETPLFPSVVGVLSAESGQPEFLYGYEAVRQAEAGHMDEGFCIFCDMKRWIADYGKEEEITDRKGRRSFVKRSDILKAYFTHVIDRACSRFKCTVSEVHVSCPVKQKAQFARLFADILPEYAMKPEDMLDEGVSVLYGAVARMARSGRAQEGMEYQALVIDCGGGTTDLCSCRFRIWDRRVSYRIEIETAYENGDTDFGGNNLTYRIMQFIKVAAVNRLRGKTEEGPGILAGFDTDIYREVDRGGVETLYEGLERAYAGAEECIPTRFKEYEHRGRKEYYMVKNNFYFLFRLAERIKKEFYGRQGILRLVLSSAPVEEKATVWIPVERFRLSADRGRGLEVLKDFPETACSIHEMELLLTGDIYHVVRRFMEEIYESGRVEDYSMIRLTGQSCRIGLFRDALKEFVPGRTIRTGRDGRERAKDAGLKTACVDGALQYLRDKRYGYADITVRTEAPALPYSITAHTHSGEEITLIHCLERGGRCGMVSRNMEDLVLKLYLKDQDGRERYQYTCHSSPADFAGVEYEDIAARYGKHIRQADTDDIVEREVKFFVWADPGNWSFCVVPVFRRDGGLFLGKEEVYGFENEGWLWNFFDGMK